VLGVMVEDGWWIGTTVLSWEFRVPSFEAGRYCENAGGLGTFEGMVCTGGLEVRKQA